MDPTAVLVAADAAKGLGPGFFNLDNMLTPQNMALIVVSWSLTELISRASGGTDKIAFAIRSRILPLLPLFFCEIAVFATANWQPTATNGERALLGALLGTVTVWGHMAAQSTGLHKLLPFMRTDDTTAPVAKTDQTPTETTPTNPGIKLPLQ